jgi:hypothetical protein
MVGKDFQLTFGVDISQLVSGMTAATEAVTASTEAMKGALASVTGAFNLLGQATIAVGAIMAGGTAFKEMVSATVNLNVSSMELGKQFGISATEASQLKVALEEVFVSQDTLSAANSRIARTLNTNEGAFKSLGVATRDQNGNFRSSLDIMLDVNARLLEFKEGTDRNVEAAKIYGRGWQEIMDVLRLTPAVFGEAKAHADALNLTVTQESEASTKAYRSAIVDMHESFDGLFNVIGQSLLPALTAMASWMAGAGVATAKAYEWSILSIKQAWIETKEGVGIAIDAIIDFVKSLAVDMMTYGKVIWDALHFNWDQAKADWKKGTDDEAAIYHQYLTNVQADQNKAAEAMQAAYQKMFGPKQATQAPTGSKDSEGGTGADKGALAALEAQLGEKKNIYNEDQLAHGSMLQFMLSDELAFWQKAYVAAEGHANLRIEIAKKIATANAAIDKEELEGNLADLKLKETAAGQNLQQRLAAERAYAQAVGSAYGLDSTKFAEAEQAILSTQNEINKQKLQIDEIYAKIKRDKEIQEITEEQAALKERLTLNGISNAAYVSQAKALEDRLTEIKRQGVEARNALEQADGQSPLQAAQVDAELQALNTEHQRAMNAITEAGVKKDQQLYQAYENKLASGFANAFSDVISRTTTVSKAFEKMWDGMVQTLIKSLAEMAVKQLAGHLLSLSMNKREAASNAAVAATGAGKAAAQVPYIGWILSPIAMAAVYAAAIAFSAEGGFDIPSGLSPVTQLHPEEMVLPAPIANTIRSAVDSGADGGGDGGGDEIHLHVHAMDSRSFHDYVHTNAGRTAIASALSTSRQRGFAGLRP